MKQLTGLDGSFLYMETPTSFGHVNGLAIYERPDGDFDPYKTVYERFASKIGELEPMRRRVVEVPMNLDHPYWVMDPNFDIDFHIRHMSLAPPGRRDQLAEQVARIVGRPMDRTRPLWEVYVIEGLEGGDWALLTKYHHATIDGASGVIMMTLMNDLTPDAPPPGESLPWQPEAIPSDAELLRLAVGNLIRNPVKALRTQLRIVREFSAAAGINSVSTAAQQAGNAIKALTGPSDEPRPATPLSAAPPTPWNRSITAHRRFAMRATKVSTLKRLKDVTGGTLNDVVMAIVAGGLRAYLQEHDALPDRPLRAMVPVSIRTGNEEEPWTNRVSSLMVDLPTHLSDPLERLATCREAMDRAKRQFELVPAEALVDIQQYSSPVVATSAIRLAARLKLADRMAPPVNVIISNVPGPRQPLYLGGARMKTYIPVSTIAEGMGLNVTVHSYLDELEFGLIACRELVPDLWHMVDLHLAEIDVLFAAAGVSRNGDAPVQAVIDAASERRPSAERSANDSAATGRASDEGTTATTSAARTSAARTTTAKRTAAERAPAKRSPGRQPTVTKRSATKDGATRTTTRRAPATATTERRTATRTSTEKSTAATAPATKTSATKQSATRTAAKGTAAKGTAATKTAARRAPAAKTAAKRSTARKQTATKTPAERTTAKTSTAKKQATGRKAAAKKTGADAARSSA